MATTNAEKGQPESAPIPLEMAPDGSAVEPIEHMVRRLLEEKLAAAPSPNEAGGWRFFSSTRASAILGVLALIAAVSLVHPKLAGASTTEIVGLEMVLGALVSTVSQVVGSLVGLTKPGGGADHA